MIGGGEAMTKGTAVVDLRVIEGAGKEEVTWSRK
jgi:hypothetical protein